MKLAIVLIGSLAGILIYFFFPKGAIAAVTSSPSSPAAPSSLDDIFIRWGTFYEVDPLLLKAIAMQESSLNPSAVNKEDNESIGLMQILCRPNGSGGCSNRFNIDGWDTATRDKLFNPDFNVQMGAQILAWNIQTFGVRKGVAVYNNWSARLAPDTGPFPNQKYVDRVMNFYNQLRGVAA